jgi:Tfp pilus assembly protein PilW
MSPIAVSSRKIVRSPRAGHTLRAEHGFTLVEMLVAMVTGMVVILATLSVLDISISQSSRISERVDADQHGRLALEKILLELHSSCIADPFTPVQSESGETTLRFISQTGNEAAFTTVTMHEIKLNTATGKLTDASYVSSPVEGTTMTFPGTPTHTETLATGVSQSKEGATVLPVFTYYKYAGGNLSGTANPIPLSKSDAEATAEVVVAFTVAPTSGRTTADRTVDLTNTAVLRYDPASAGGSNTPCA